MPMLRTVMIDEIHLIEYEDVRPNRRQFIMKSRVSACEGNPSVVDFEYAINSAETPLHLLHPMGHMWGIKVEFLFTNLECFSELEAGLGGNVGFDEGVSRISGLDEGICGLGRSVLGA